MRDNQKYNVSKNPSDNQKVQLHETINGQIIILLYTSANFGIFLLAILAFLSIMELCFAMGSEICTGHLASDYQMRGGKID